MKQKLFFYLIIETFLSCLVNGQYYLNDGVVKFIVGLGLPFDVELPGGSLSWFTNVQVFYKLPDNISYYEPYQVMQKRSVKSTFNRYNIYQALAKFFERLGFTGSDCIYRVICDTARSKLNRKRNGILGEIIKILFSPGKDLQQGLEKHRKAERQGLFNNSDCGLIYSDCKVQDDSIFLS